ncbi:hypothetical protein CLV78_103400 [Aliiruegeria haliotis]|uniref:Uncharacterized protein n=1 Tax=Aliiruegeria haliotis TaxID=1280846 RepID=A0A2T0RTQ6_9RHOB|nr:hypothetical protein [Aliiruegeria haliotis]PRY24532.1 hypothetical protein CLV78_103400 [Aliiruegeria haliotis]
MKKVFAGAVLALSTSTTAYAVPVSYGALSSNTDGSTEVITDSLNNLEWMRWDILADLTYQQTVDLIGAGGARESEGWMIADKATAQAFTDAFLDGQFNNCSVTGSSTCADGLGVNSDALVGYNYSAHPTMLGFCLTTVLFGRLGIS